MTGSSVGGKVFSQGFKELEGNIGLGRTVLENSYHATHLAEGRSYESDCPVCNP